MSAPQSPSGSPQASTGDVAPQTRKGNGFGVAALVLSIFAIVFAFVPFVSYAAIVAGVAAVVLGIFGLLKKYRPHGTSIAGVAIGAIALILAIVMTILYAAVFFGVSKAVHDEQKAASATHTVVYTVTGPAQDADITYSTYTGGSFGSQQSTSTPLPFTKSITVKGSTAGLSFNSFTLTAINGINDTGAISCSITVDGKTVANQTSTGSLADVTCSGSN
jgi:Mycobacterium membrane protein